MAPYYAHSCSTHTDRDPRPSAPHLGAPTATLSNPLICSLLLLGSLWNGWLRRMRRSQAQSHTPFSLSTGQEQINMYAVPVHALAAERWVCRNFGSARCHTGSHTSVYENNNVRYYGVRAKSRPDGPKADDDVRHEDVSIIMPVGESKIGSRGGGRQLGRWTGVHTSSRFSCSEFIGLIPSVADKERWPR